MLFNSLFSGLYDSSGTLSLSSFLICTAVALVLGAMIAAIYAIKNTYTKGFLMALALLPSIVSIIIMMTSGSIGAGIAVAGAFALVRFRSVPGTAKELVILFFSMSTGLACGAGYPGFAALFTIIIALAFLLYDALGIRDKTTSAREKTLNITIPEDLEYAGVFDPILSRYALEYHLVRVKTTNLGSLNRLTYALTLKEAGTEKAMIDELRVRNGNLEISLECRMNEAATSL